MLTLHFCLPFCSLQTLILVRLRVAVTVRRMQADNALGADNNNNNNNNGNGNGNNNAVAQPNDGAAIGLQLPGLNGTGWVAQQCKAKEKEEKKSRGSE